MEHTAVMAGPKEEQRQRVALIGKTLRKSVAAPTDTYITDDIPLLLTRLSQVAPIPSRGHDEAEVDRSGADAHNRVQEASS